MKPVRCCVLPTPLIFFPKPPTSGNDNGFTLCFDRHRYDGGYFEIFDWFIVFIFIVIDIMSNNLYGYTDYHGPQIANNQGDKEAAADADVIKNGAMNYYDDDDDNPLRAGLWMEGDSLAPPCGSSIPLIHSLLSFASVSSKDVLYDFGCGDGRICLEALVKSNCRQCVGVEVEDDLVVKGNELISKLPNNYKLTSDGKPRVQLVQADLREIIQGLLVAQNPKAESNDETSSFRDLPMPTIIVLYLLPEAIAEMGKDLIALLRYSRIVCNTWGLPSVKHSKKIVVPEEGGASTTLFLYSQETDEDGI